MSGQPGQDPASHSQAGLRARLLPPFAALDVVGETASTNAALAARADAADRTVLVAEHQIAGRGRAGRSWVAPPRSGLAVSVLLRPPVPQARWGWLPLLAGVALADVVAELGGVPAALKWPNDLLVRDGKAAGILAEVVAGPAVVLGIGLNVALAAPDLPVPTATSLAVEGAACLERDALLTALLLRLHAADERWRAAGGDAERCGLAAEYRARCATLGRAVRVALPGRELVGTAEDVDAGGRLVVRTGAGREVLSAGEVTHVRPAER